MWAVVKMLEDQQNPTSVELIGPFPSQKSAERYAKAARESEKIWCKKHNVSEQFLHEYSAEELDSPKDEVLLNIH